jgi:hypothetical protein
MTMFCSVLVVLVLRSVSRSENSSPAVTLVPP